MDPAPATPILSNAVDSRVEHEESGMGVLQLDRRNRTVLWPIRLGAGLAALSLATAGVALATPGAGITSSNISVGVFEDVHVKTHVDGHKVSIDTRGVSDVYVVSNVIAPGGHSGWHTQDPVAPCEWSGIAPTRHRWGNSRAAGMARRRGGQLAARRALRSRAELIERFGSRERRC